MFTVVIPLYNKEKSILNTIQSVLEQTFQEFEIVVVNDGSTDNSAEIVACMNDPRIRLVNQENRGVSSARNRGIKEAKFEWIAFLDGDDLWKKEYLLEMKQLICDFPNAPIYGANYYVYYEEMLLVNKNNIEDEFRGEIDNYYSIALNGLLFSSSSSVIHKNKLCDILFDERLSLGEDLDFWLRAVGKGIPVFFNKPLAVYNHDGPNRAMNNKHDITKNFIFYSSKYIELEKNDKDFNKLINTIKLRKIPEVFLFSNASDKQLKTYLSAIDYKYQQRKHIYFSWLPFTLKKILIRLKYSNK